MVHSWIFLFHLINFILNCTFCPFNFIFKFLFIYFQSYLFIYFGCIRSQLRHMGSLLQHAGFSLVVLCRFSPLQLWCAGSRACGLCSCGTRAQQLWHTGLAVLRCVGTQFPNQGSYSHLLHWKADSLTLDHEGNPLSI